MKLILTLLITASLFSPIFFCLPAMMETTNTFSAAPAY